MMPKLNHTIVSASDAKASALFLSDLLGLEPPHQLGPFSEVTVGDELTLDFIDADGPIASRYFAFLVTEEEFDVIFTRIEERGIAYWADPMHRKQGEINHWDDGRGIYFDDPDGHNLEILTRSYGSAGTKAENPHPLIKEEIRPSEASQRAREPVERERPDLCRDDEEKNDAS